MSNHSLFRFMIEPHRYLIVGDKHAIDTIDTMNDKSDAYDDCLPTEPNPERTRLIDRERLAEMYDGDVPFQEQIDAAEDAGEDEIVLQGGEILSLEEDDTAEADGQ